MDKNRPTFSRKKTTNGTLRTPVTFYEAYKTGPYPNSKDKQEVYRCFGEIYNPSIKDIEIMNAQGVSSGLTLIIRDTQGEFIPTQDHIIKINNRYFGNTEYRIIDLSPTNNLLKLILTGVYDG